MNRSSGLRGGIPRYCVVVCASVYLGACNLLSLDPAAIEPDLGFDGSGDGSAEVNGCGGVVPLRYEGIPAEPGDACGCGGTLVCNGIVALWCANDTVLNACQGCGDLEGEPGAECGPCGDGAFVCRGTTVVCEGASTLNLCGGCGAALDLDGEARAPGDPCGADAWWACADGNLLECADSALTNPCGGAEPLTFDGRASLPGGACEAGCGTGVLRCEPSSRTLSCDGPVPAACGCGPAPFAAGAPCGCRGQGAWQCADGGGVVCVGGETNACGGCSELADAPGEPCAGGARICAGVNATTCATTRPANACGGESTLPQEPGGPCGSCQSGRYTCDGLESVVCTGDRGARAFSSCGGCEALPGAVGDRCGTCAAGAWECAASDEIVCVGGDAASRNACGGCGDLAETQDAACGACASWQCVQTELVCAFDVRREGCAPADATCAELQCETVGRTCEERTETSPAYCGACLEGGHEVDGRCVVTPVCGDGVVQAGEDCDGLVPADLTCASEGYLRGALACVDCALDLGDCRRLPQVETTAASASGHATAELDGVVADLGARSLTDHGFCVGEGSAPALDEDPSICFSLGTLGAAGVFGTDAGGLRPATSYRARAFAANEEGVAYGRALEFTTAAAPNICGDGIRGDMDCDGEDLGVATCEVLGFPDGGPVACTGDCLLDTSGCWRPPVVVTSGASSVTHEAAIVSGALNEVGVPPAEVQGVCLRAQTEGAPESCVASDATPAAGTFDVWVGGLTPGTRYDVQAYATNETGTARGDTLELQTLPLCGDGIVGAPEACDGPIGGEITCVDAGFDAGALGCSAACSLDTSSCERRPSVTTLAPSAIEARSVRLNGRVDDRGVPEIAEAGFCVSEGALPSLDDAVCRMVALDASDDYGLSIDELEQSTTYTVRAVADHAAGVVYGEPVSFRTGARCGDGVIGDGEDCDTTELGDATCVDAGFEGGTLQCTSGCAFDDSECIVWPVVRTGAPLLISSDGATLSGELVIVGTPAPARHGFCVGSDPLPQEDGASICSDLGARSTAGAFEYIITGLAGSTDYHVRAYASNGHAPVYGVDEVFRTLAPPARCGDGLINGAEECDGAVPEGVDCVTAGYSGGAIACTGSCMLSIAACWRPPTIVTTSAVALSDTVLALSGSITDLGGSAVAAHGFCVGPSAAPSIGDASTLCGDLGPTSLPGTFADAIDGLTAGATYRVRAYGISAVGSGASAIGYGDELAVTMPVLREQCANGADDDGDLDIDCADTECSANLACAGGAPDGARCQLDGECASGRCASAARLPEHRRCAPVAIPAAVSGPIAFAFAPAGTFTQGSPLGEASRLVDEVQWEATLGGAYFVSETEVTQGQWAAATGVNPACFQRPGDTGCSLDGLAPDFPVERVDWWAALAFANWVSDNDNDDTTARCYSISPLSCADEVSDWGDGVAGDRCLSASWLGGLGCTGYRLLTESEWELAARQPITFATILDAYFWGTSATGAASYATTNNGSGGRTSRVRSHSANGLGLYDTAGNVLEWVWDWYAPYPLAASSDYIGPTTGTDRVQRGGHYYLEPSSVRSAARFRAPPSDAVPYVGVRLARTAAAGVCGDGHVNGAEGCDGANLAWSTCDTLGYDAGVLSCAGGCRLDESGCTRWPTVATGAIRAAYATALELEGSITNAPVPSVIDHGVCVAPSASITTSGEPSVGGASSVCTTLGPAASSGNFVARVSVLSPATEYAYRAFARNSDEVVYGASAPVATADVPETDCPTEISADGDVTPECAAPACATLAACAPSAPLGAECASNGDCDSGFCAPASRLVSRRCAPRTDTGMEFAYIPAGTLRQGDPATTGGSAPWTATVSRPYFIATTEVTQAQWVAVSGGVNPACYQTVDGTVCTMENSAPDHPVEDVEFFAVIGFLNHLSATDGDPTTTPYYTALPLGCDDDWQDGLDASPLCTSVQYSGFGRGGYRLATESEWERAMRGPVGAGAEASTYYWGEATDGATVGLYAWFTTNSGGRSHAVGQLAPNGYGLLDMAGNVSELVFDRYGNYPTSPATDHEGASTGTNRVARGGSHDSPATSLTTFYRQSVSATTDVDTRGFRVARSTPH